MSDASAELKGAVLRGLLRDAKELPGGIAALMTHMPADRRETYFASGIVHGMWYSYKALASLLDAYAKMPGFGRPQDFQRLGAKMAERDFTTLLRVYAMVVSPARLADVPRQIWLQRFRNAGSATSEAGDKSFRFTISGFAAIHPLQCEILTGYGARVGQQRAKSFTTVHDRCVHRGAGDCSWLSTW